SGDLDRHHDLFAYEPMLIAARRTFAHGLAHATAGGAGGNGLHLAQEGALYAAHLAVASARGTGAVFAAFPAHQFGHLDLLFRSVGDLLEGELQAHAQVAAFHYASAATSAAETTESAATEGIAEDVAELGE